MAEYIFSDQRSFLQDYWTKNIKPKCLPQFPYSHYRYDNEHVSKNSSDYNKYHYESRRNCHQNFDPFLIRYHVSTGCVVNICEYCGVIPIENGHIDRFRRCCCDVFWWWGRQWYQGRHCFALNSWWEFAICHRRVRKLRWETGWKKSSGGFYGWNEKVFFGSLPIRRTMWCRQWERVLSWLS